MRSLLVVALLAATAHADRRGADQLLADAQQTHDEAKFVACGHAYLDVYNHDPAASDNDEVLFNAAVCYGAGRSIGAALQTFDVLLRYYPKSRLAPHALMRTALAYEQIARFDEAAARFERYAKTYAGEKDARDALSNAVRLRAALGDRARRIDDTKLFVRNYGAKSPREAADAMFELAGAYESLDDQIAALRDFVKLYATKAAHERVAVAYTRLGDALWRKSCPTTLVDGLCVKRAHDDAAPRCDPAAVRVDAVARATTVRAEALAAFDRAIRIVDDLRLGDRESAHAAAMARLAHADGGLEALIAQHVPNDLDFDPSPARQAVRARSTKRLADWLAVQNKATATLTRRYQDVLAMKDPSTTIVALARLGQTQQAFARALVAATIPKDVRGGPYEVAYCGALVERAERFAARAKETFAACVDRAEMLGVVDAAVAVCRREAGRPAEIVPPLTYALAPVVAAPARGGEPAFATFAANDHAGWTDATCRESAAAFATIAKRASNADARYMEGLSYHRCAFAGDARRAYEQAGDHAAALANLGELAWRDGRFVEATTRWKAALARDPRLFAAHVDLAIAGDDVALHAGSALALTDDPLPLAALAFATTDRDLSRAYADAGLARDDKHAELLAVRAVVAARRDEWMQASLFAERAAQVAPRVPAVQRLAGLVAVRLGRYDAAAAELAAVAPAYDVLVARAIAARGRGDGGAVALYEQAIGIDSSRAEAHYDLGLYFELYANPRDPQRARDENAKAAAIDPALRR